MSVPDGPTESTSKNSLAILGFCELLAWIFAEPPVDAFYRGDPVSLKMGSFFLIGCLFAVSGPSWPWLKPWSKSIGWPHIADRFAGMAADPRWWMATLLAFLVSGGSVPFLGSIETLLSRPYATIMPKQNSAPTPAVSISAMPLPVPPPPTPIPFSAGPLTWADGIIFTAGVEQLKRPCIFKITVPFEHRALRKQLVTAILTPTHILSCQVRDNVVDNDPEDIDPRNPRIYPPNPGVIVHAPPGPNGEAVVSILKAMHLIIIDKVDDLPRKSPRGLIYLEFGKGWPWEY
jgi:hypothetical protein